MHPNRLVEFESQSPESRLSLQFVIAVNRNMNSSLTLTVEESCRRPDPLTMLLLTVQIINEVEQAFITFLTGSFISDIINIGASYQFKEASFKKSQMKESQLSVVIIEAALTYIIDHLHERSQLVVALDTAKIGYHDYGLVLEDIGTRIFVVKGFKTRNTA